MNQSALADGRVQSVRGENAAYIRNRYDEQAKKEQLPHRLVRPEVYNLLAQRYNVPVDAMDKQSNNPNQRELFNGYRQLV